jgi:hypothetical protein
MLSIGSLAYRRVADAKVGNLIYVLDPDGLDLALCIEHPGGATGGKPYNAALRLLGKTRLGRMPIVDTGVSNCIDWGQPAVVRWQHPLTLLRQSAPPDAGYIILVGDIPAISSHYADGRGDRMYWEVLTGKPVAPGAADYILLAKWILGATSTEGSFLPLASYPDDFGRSGDHPQ